jgi:hypothetical protein
MTKTYERQERHTMNTLLNMSSIKKDNDLSILLRTETNLSKLRRSI